MASQPGLECSQNRDDVGNASQMSQGISVRTQDNCSAITQPNDMKPLCSVMTDLNCNDTSNTGLDCGQNKDNLVVIKQVLANICDRIATIDCSDGDSNNWPSGNQNNNNKQNAHDNKSCKHNIPTNKQNISSQRNVSNEQSASDEQNVTDKQNATVKQIQCDGQSASDKTNLETNGKKMVTSADESDSSDDSSSGDENSDSESSTDDSSISGSEDDDEDLSGKKMTKQKIPYVCPKTKDELTFADLPDVQPLDLCVDESVELTPLGEVKSILPEDAFVIIKSFENVPAVDADSILFLQNRSGFGRVFEIFGKVRNPHYCVRFNNIDEIKSTNVEIGQTVYFAPDTKDVTNFVFVSQLNGIKGSDASWKDDQEPPAEFLDYSDDESETQQRKQKKCTYQLKRRSQSQMQEQGPIANSRKKQKPFKPHKNASWTETSRPQQNDQSYSTPQRQQANRFVSTAHGSGFVSPTHEQPGQVILPPNDQNPTIRIPAQSRPGPHQQPFPPPPMGPPSRHFSMPYWGPPGHPGQSFQNFAQPSPPGRFNQRNQMQNQRWDCPPHNTGVGYQPWIRGNNMPPYRPPMNQYHWPVGQPNRMVQRAPLHRPPINQHPRPGGELHVPTSSGGEPDMSVLSEDVRKYLGT